MTRLVIDLIERHVAMLLACDDKFLELFVHKEILDLVFGEVLVPEDEFSLLVAVLVGLESTIFV